MSAELLKGFPIRIEIPVAWGEMDTFGHVNNVAYFRYFESARIAYFEALEYLELMRDTSIGPILAETECRFRIPLEYPDKVMVGARVTEIGDEGFVMRYAAVSHRHGRMAAEGSGRIVSFDYRNQRKAPLQKELRARLARLESSG